MASFWLTKEMLEEALTLVADKPKSTMVYISGSSENKNNRVNTIMEFSSNGKKKKIKRDYNKIIEANINNENILPIAL